MISINMRCIVHYIYYLVNIVQVFQEFFSKQIRLNDLAARIDQYIGGNFVDPIKICHRSIPSA